MISCNQDKGQLSKISGIKTEIDASFSEVDSIASFIAPFKHRIDQVLDSTLAFAPKSLLLDDGTRNTSMGNLMADIVFEETQAIFKSKTGKTLDFAVLNRGGIRSIISGGNVSARNAYEVMPFENYIAVVELDGSAVRKLVTFLTTSERPHPFSGMQIILDSTGKLESVNIQGSPFDEGRSYTIATSDYLVQGGSSIGFFPKIISSTDTGYLLRNAIIDYFKKVDTLKAEVDNRFIQLY
ncbi:MAG: 5'-nucleotidase C-terminal domain-containing protein [Flavobacteriaceae bacterium]